jgi:succinyl-CoA synthetase beta subunit
MHLHEYQAKQLLSAYGVPVPAGVTAASLDEAEQAARTLGGSAWAVKAQVHAGGRGKAGGVRLVRDPGELRQVAGRLLGSRLVTAQTTAAGQPVGRVLVEAPVAIAAEYYLSLLVDRARGRVMLVASAAGGMDIETVAAEQPERIVTLAVDPAAGLQPYHARRIGFALGLDEDLRRRLGQILEALYRLFLDQDLGLLELNPLVRTQGGDLLALDAKIHLDDNALFRHPDLAALHDATQEDERETRARRFDLSYIALDGDIACMVNGAGLAMATMDLIKLHGGEPANFLDVGGGTTADRVAEAFKLILADAKVRAILVNIFGGIVRCDLIAEGIIQAVREVGIQLPVVVRLEGTNAERGRELLEHSGLAIIAASGLSDAAGKAVAAARQPG